MITIMHLTSFLFKHTIKSLYQTKQS